MKITQSIDDEVRRCLLPQAIVIYEAGATLTFGDVRINMQGISTHHGKRFFVWQEVKKVTISESTLEINSGRVFGKSARVFGKALTNISTLAGVIEHIRGHYQFGQ